MNKKEKIEELTKFEYLMLHIRPDINGVSLPKTLMAQKTVALKISQYFVNPLIIDESGIKIELLFDNESFPCIIPYEAIWACTTVDGEHTFWEEGLPKELVLLMKEVKKNSKKESKVTESKIKKTETINRSKKEENKKKINHLKLVK